MKTDCPPMRLPLLIVALGAAIFTGCSSPPKTAYRPDWLAPASKIVFATRREDSAVGEATFKLKATATEAEFQDTVKRIGLKPFRDVSPASYTNEPPQWKSDTDTRWDVGPELDDSFILKR